MNIEQLAREAGYDVVKGERVGESSDRELFERFAMLVAAHEREQCARVCDVTPPQPFRPSIEAAHAIRARTTP